MLELLVLAIAPALFIFLYIYRKDCYEPEPLSLVLWVFFLGALSVIPALLLEMPFTDEGVSSTIAAPVIEESLKFLVVFLTIYRNPKFDEPMDGIVYAMAAGLGFATIENIFYVLDGGVAVGILRAIASVPGHVIFSCIWGFALGTAKFRPETKRIWIILPGLFGAMFLHGLFNFSLEFLEASGIVLILFVIIPAGWWMTCRNIRCAHTDPASASSRFLSQLKLVRLTNNAPVKGAGPSQFCTNCGKCTPVDATFCENCGKELELSFRGR
jgi:RsiW-degrading membrane proteinase PrsW (M82 family)